MQNPYKAKDDDTVDFTAYQKQPGVVESGQVSQGQFDSARGNKPSGEGKKQAAAGAQAGAQAAAAGGDLDSVAETSLISSGNPYAMAAGVALAAFNAGERQKYEAEVAQRNAELATQQRMVQSSREAVSAYDRSRNLVG